MLLGGSPARAEMAAATQASSTSVEFGQSLRWAVANLGPATYSGYWTGGLLLAAGVMGVAWLRFLWRGTRKDFEREWSVAARPSIVPELRRVLPSTPATFPGGPSGETLSKPLERVVAEDLRLKDELFRPLLRLPMPRALAPGQMKRRILQALKRQRDGTRLASQTLSRCDAAIHGQIIKLFNGIRRKEGWRPVLLPSLDLSGRSLCHADFRGCVLLHVDMSRTDLRQANFLGAVLWGVRFDGALMEEDMLEFLRRSGNATLTGLDSVECWGIQLSDGQYAVEAGT